MKWLKKLCAITAFSAMAAGVVYLIIVYVAPAIIIAGCIIGEWLQKHNF